MWPCCTTISVPYGLKLALESFCSDIVLCYGLGMTNFLQYSDKQSTREISMNSKVRLATLEDANLISAFAIATFPMSCPAS
jgi:hypothetical protein